MFQKAIAATIISALGFATTSASGQTAASQAQPERELARLKEGMTLLTSANLSATSLAACQPLRGETVEIQRWVMMDPKIPGLQAAQVRVMEGRCKGAEGFVGLQQLEAMGKPSGEGVAR